MERWKVAQAGKLLGAKEDKKSGKMRMFVEAEIEFPGEMLIAPQLLLDTVRSLMLEKIQGKRAEIEELIAAPTRAAYMEKRNGKKEDA